MVSLKYQENMLQTSMLSQSTKDLQILDSASETSPLSSNSPIRWMLCSCSGEIGQLVDIFWITLLFLLTMMGISELRLLIYLDGFWKLLSTFWQRILYSRLRSISSLKSSMLESFSLALYFSKNYSGCQWSWHFNLKNQSSVMSPLSRRLWSCSTITSLLAGSKEQSPLCCLLDCLAGFQLSVFFLLPCQCLVIGSSLPTLSRTDYIFQLMPCQSFTNSSQILLVPEQITTELALAGEVQNGMLILGKLSQFSVFTNTRDSFSSRNTLSNTYCCSICPKYPLSIRWICSGTPYSVSTISVFESLSGVTLSKYEEAKDMLSSLTSLQVTKARVYDLKDLKFWERCCRSQNFPT